MSTWFRFPGWSRLFPGLSAGVFLLASTLVLATVHTQISDHVVEDAEQKARIVLSHGLAVYRASASSQATGAQSGLDGNGATDAPDAAPALSLQGLRKILRDFSSFGGEMYAFRMPEMDGRDPEAEAREWERAFIEDCRREPLREVRFAVCEIEGEPYLTALLCGEQREDSRRGGSGSPVPGLIDPGRMDGGERPAGLPGSRATQAFSVCIPLAGDFQRANVFSLQLAGILFAVFLVLLGLWRRFKTRFLVGVAREITERVQAEEALKRSEEKFAKAFRASPVAMSLSTLREGRIFDVNRAFEVLSGLDREEILGRTSVELGLIDEEERSRLKGLLDAHGRIRDVEVRIRRPAGDDALVTVSVEPVDISGEPCILFIGDDITEKKRMEDALKESEELFSEIFRLSPEMAIITREKDGTVIAVNETFLKKCGYRREELLGRTTLDLGIWGSSRDRQQLLDIYRRDGFIQNAETVLHTRSGEPFPVMYSLVSVEFKGESCLFAMGMDISERKKAEEERERLEGLLRHSQKMEAIGTLAGGIAHDFNNILAATIGFTELAKIRTIDGNARRGYLDQILKASLRARDLVKQILVFSRMEPSEEPQPLRLSLVVGEILKFLRASIPSTIEIRQNISLRSDTVLADPAQVNQILVNLVTNAAQAMEEEGGVLEVSLKDVALPPGLPTPHPDLLPGEYVRLIVNDTGHGIPPGAIERIFDPYFTTKEAGKGTGLGLAIVHGIVKRHGGAITVQSEPGSGAAFSIYLPKAKDVLGEEDLAPDELPGGTERILLVDDEELIADVVALMLGDLGYRVSAVTRPVEALALFQKDPGQFDLLISDFTMPGLTGAELATCMRDVRPELPVIMVTGFSERMDEERAKELRFDAFLMKPLQRWELAQTVRKVMDARKPN